MKVIIWGTGWAEELFYKYTKYNWHCDVIAYTDNNSEKWNTSHRGKRIVSPFEISKMTFDMVIICVMDSQIIYNQLVEQLEIPKEKILTFQQNKKRVEKELYLSLIAKYANSSDPDIHKVIDFYRDNSFNVYGYYNKRDIDYKVYYDEENDPYVLFEGKKMYYPKNYSFSMKNGHAYVENILGEQLEGSPHLYLKHENEIKEGSIVVDAGVCEGNFALRYIDKVKKMYLIEADSVWMTALRKTFAPYVDKVVFCNKFLGKCDNGHSITLDTLIGEGNIDFLKMDIEGAEIDALLGARKTLEHSNAKCSICSYHKQCDEKYIRYILESYGYQTSTSEGYMFFEFDNDIFDSLDFRRGIVYGVKCETR